MSEPLLRSRRLSAVEDNDPREGQGAEVISLATRSVMPAVTQRKGSSDALGLAAGIACDGA
jgi:type IV secretion system protein VirB10